MNAADTITARIHAVLDHDGIEPKHRAAYLRDTCGISISTARRVLRETKSTSRIILKLVKGLDVCWLWLWNGEFERFHARTCKIFIQSVKGYPPNEAAKVVRFMFGVSAGHHKAKTSSNCVRLARYQCTRHHDYIQDRNSTSTET